MSSLKFQIPSCRNGFHLVDQSITFTTYDGIPDGQDALIALSLSTTPDGPHAKDIRKLAVSWLEVWNKSLAVDHASPVESAANTDTTNGDANSTPTEADRVAIPSSKHMLEQLLQHGKQQPRTYQRHVFLSTLYNECPSVEGRNNLAFEILLTVIPPTPTGEECKITTVEELLSRAVYTESSAARAFQRLSQLADYIVICLIQPFRKYASATPCAPTLEPFKHDPKSPLDEATQERRHNLQEKVCQRDELRCAVTGVLPYNVEHLFTTAQIEKQALEFEPVQCAYIIPPTNQLPVSSASTSFRTVKEKMKFRALLTFLHPSLSRILHSHKLDGPTNALLLSHSAAFRFANLHIWLTPTHPDTTTSLDDNVNDNDTPATTNYKIQALRRSRLPRPLPPNDTITFTHGGEIPPPSRNLLQLHRALAIATSTSAAGEFLDAVAEDVENISLAAVGERTAECIYYMLLAATDFL
ncbi:hypothetical protein Dda_1497 [Drechslerella dactyloides]|uniref:HNH nuclease domain-containing protein n=1 Tax=Drechslerella dactyloides TaxID=74499 RepID=A0AAD6J3K3_DREDA|nr:hypothetical protein Dda_1497 [Drechslerella dactyloides]